MNRSFHHLIRTILLLVVGFELVIFVVLNLRSDGFISQVVAPNTSVGYAALLCLVGAYYFRWTRSADETSWVVFLVAWALALIDSLLGIVATFSFMSHQIIEADDMMPALESVLSGFVLPGFLSIPFIGVVQGDSKTALSLAIRSFAISILIGCLDVVVLALWTVAAIGARIANDGATIEWSKFGLP